MKHSDRATLRNILVNTLYYYNCPEKLESVMDKLGRDKDSTLQDDLAAEKALQAIDDAAYSLHFVLQQLGSST